MYSNPLRPLAQFASVSPRLAKVPAAAAGVFLFATTAAAEPFSLQEWQGVTTERESVGLATVSPFYGGDFERPVDQTTWRDRAAIGFEERPDVPTGLIASVGRFGLKLDSSESGGPRVGGLSWSPSESVSFVAGGDLGRGTGGVGASLSVRIGF